MIIGWATPFNIRSAIGKFSRFVCEEIRERGHEVTIIRTETGPELTLAALETDLHVISAADMATDYDILVANFGNHAPYHAQLVSVLARRAPLALLHDVEMADFAWGLQYRHGIQLPQLIGQRDEEAADGDFVSSASRPFISAVAAMSWGAVVHGPHYEPIVSRYCAGPVKVIPLCYPDMGIARDPPPPAAGRRVLIFGVVSEHKQPRRVMRAIAKLKNELGAIELHLAGSIEEKFRNELLKEASGLDISPPIFHGYVSDERLQSIIENSHVVCCLRYPITEGGSASLITALYRGRPLIIADVASYSIVPDDLAFKISYGNETTDLETALKAIFKNPEVAERKAQKAQSWAKDRFSAKAYVDALEPLIGNRPAAVVAELARDLVPAITAPDGEVMFSAVPAFAGALDWMIDSQTTAGAMVLTSGKRDPKTRAVRRPR